MRSSRGGHMLTLKVKICWSPSRLTFLVLPRTGRWSQESLLPVLLVLLLLVFHSLESMDEVHFPAPQEGWATGSKRGQKATAREGDRGKAACLQGSPGTSLCTGEWLWGKGRSLGAYGRIVEGSWSSLLGKAGKEKPDLGNHTQDQPCNLSFLFFATAPVHRLAGTWPGLPWKGRALSAKGDPREHLSRTRRPQMGNDIFIHTNVHRILPNVKQISEEQLSVFQLLYSYFSRGYYSRNGYEAI